MKKCRFCNTPLSDLFLSLGSSPLANSYLKQEDLAKMEPYYPLEVYVCRKCYLVQLEEVESAENIFSSDYAYYSSYSDSWLRHCQKYTEMIVERFKFDESSLVVEIASNDGYLLQYFKQRGVPVLGIEPATKVAQVAIGKGIPSKTVFFDADYARTMVNEGRLADLIVGNNVLAHNPNLNSFVQGLKIALKPQGVITLEFPHLLKLIQENQFDTIYHEHFSYFSFYAVRKIFAYHELSLFDVEELPSHGGSLRIYAKHSDDESKPISKRVGILLEKEKLAGLLDIETYYHFGQKVDLTKRKLLKLLIQLKNEGKKIIGYGAPAKGNTLLNYCGIRSDFLDYTVDRSPHKQNKFLPGTRIAVKHPDAIKEYKPDYVLILPWNLKDEIMEQMSFIKEWGGKFVIPIPEVKVV